MESEEYDEQRASLETEYRAAATKLQHKYATESVRFAIGDVLVTPHQCILVDKIGWARPYREDSYPYALYYGKVLTKKLVPRGDGQRGTIGDSGTWLVEKIGVGEGL